MKSSIETIIFRDTVGVAYGLHRPPSRGLNGVTEVLVRKYYRGVTVHVVRPSKGAKLVNKSGNSYKNSVGNVQATLLANKGSRASARKISITADDAISAQESAVIVLLHVTQQWG